MAPSDAQLLNEMDYLVIRKGVIWEVMDNMRALDLVPNLSYFRDRFPAAVRRRTVAVPAPSSAAMEELASVSTVPLEHGPPEHEG